MKFITQAAKVLNEQKKYKRRLAVFLCLAVVVALGTAAALKMYGQAMSHKQKKLVCRYAAHAHTDGCFDGEAVVCGYADYAVHLHNDDCYGPNGELVCHLPEAEAHVHTEECYTEQEVLICEEEGAQAHEHTEGCYTPERGDLSCQMEEHMHEDSCYGENGEIICPMEEHQHDDNCYEWKDVLTCTLGGHEHTQDCYTREMRDLSCNLEEHGHGEACYDENGELACQLEEHTHDDDCYVWEDVLTCQLEESDGGHVHGDGCYEMQKVLSCGKLELHTHDDSCYDGNGALTCGLLQLEEHVHGEDCFETVELTEEEIIALSGAGEESVSGDAVSEDSVSGDSVSADDAKEAHEHTDECYDAAGGLICGFETAEEPSITKTFEDEKYIITAAYDKEANIPEDAELYAEMITAESNEEHYAQREAELKETLQDENVKMDALFKIGFYVDGQEIEPESDVMITVQFLDENGMADGIPMTIVHFADGGSEILGGSHAKDGSTTFKTRGFSEFGIVSDYETLETAEQADEVEEYSSVSGRINLSESFRYENENYNITFHIKGTAEVPAGTTVSGDKTQESISSNEAEEDSSVMPDEDSGDNEAEEETDESSGEDTESQEESSAGELENDTEETEDVSASDEEVSEKSDAPAGADEEEMTEDESVSSNQSQENTGEQKAEFKVELLGEDTKAYAAVNEYAQKTDKGGTELLLDVLSYSVTYGGVELDVSDCEMTAEITPSRLLLEQAKKMDAWQNEKEDDGEKESEKENVSVALTLLKMSANAEVSRVDEVDVDESTVDEIKIYTMPAKDVAVFAVNAAGQYDPKFTVQYYANLNQVLKESVQSGYQPDSKKRELAVIDTSMENNQGGLPKNGETPKLKKIIVSENGMLKTENKLEKVYESEKYNYIKAPNLTYFNKLYENGNYELKEVWVLKDDTQSESIDKAYWDIYDSNNVHFSNREESNKEKGIIKIEDDTVIRLVYDTTTKKYTNEVNFYDYDITDDGSATSTRIGDLGKAQEGVIRTRGKGINSPGNYKSKTQNPIFAFGNGNTGTGLWTQTFDDNGKTNYINKRNRDDAGNDISYAGCTFNLATRLKNDGTIEYNNKLSVPNLFNDGAAIGKTTYDDYSLTFNRDGDGYTLSAAASLGNLEYFVNPQSQHTHIWTNNFWPMDIVKNKDLHTGQAGDTGTFNGYAQTGGPGWNEVGSYDERNYPPSDDGKAHNNMFGMHFAVDFELTKDYVGPLDYLFFGDDDMWVFLDKLDSDGNVTNDPKFNGKLVCDIGGLHSSVGEYVQLWDYIDKNDPQKAGKYRLTFFYTERGLSGSTCYMQFTLPSVSTATPKQTTGNLKVLKESVKISNGEEGPFTDGDEEKDREFSFTIKLTANESGLNDDYSYTIYDTNNSEVETDLITREGNLSSGTSFKLKPGQYILINYLPLNMGYEIVEDDTNLDDYRTDITIENVPQAENTQKNRVVKGTITEKGKTITVKYKNKFYLYKLPETGGPGTTIIYMAVLLLAGTAALLKYKQLRYRREGVNR